MTLLWEYDNSQIREGKGWLPVVIKMALVHSSPMEPMWIAPEALVAFDDMFVP